MVTRFSDNDIRFLAEAIDPRLGSKLELLKDDPQIIESILDQEFAILFERIMLMDEETMAMITPRFLFEVLVRKAAYDLKSRNYTIERTSSQRIPVFDAPKVSQFLEDKAIIGYLVDLLDSFIRVHSFTVNVRLRKGIWRKIRFNDMDLDNLIQMCEKCDETERFGYYKRIADLCLFILGIFPEHVGIGGLFPLGGEASPGFSCRLRKSADEYEQQGRLFYKLAGQHRDARILELTGVFSQLNENFTLAKKPLNYISDNYLKFGKVKLFPAAN